MAPTLTLAHARSLTLAGCRKGDSSYYTIHANGKDFENAAWYYPQPFEKAKHIKDHVAFYKNVVKVEKEE